MNGKISLGDRMAIAGTLRMLGEDSGQSLISKEEANRLADMITPSHKEIIRMGNAIMRRNPTRKPIAKIAEEVEA